MGFRQTNNQDHIYLLDHGDCYDTGWTIMNLNKHQLTTLRNLVLNYPGGQGSTLLMGINRKLAGAS